MRAKRTYTHTGFLGRRVHEQSAKKIVNAAEKYLDEYPGAHDDRNYGVAWEAMNDTNYEYRVLMGFVLRELSSRGYSTKRVEDSYIDMHGDLGAESKYGHEAVVQEAYDTVPIHPYWGGPATPDNTEINPYYTTDFYQALSGGGGGDMSGGAGIQAGIESEEEMEDDFSLDGDVSMKEPDEEFSFKDFLSNELNDDTVFQLKGGWKLYRIDDEGSNGEEQQM